MTSSFNNIQVGGTLRQKSFYVIRPALEADLKERVLSGKILQVVGCRTQGKSSLLWHSESDFRQQGVAMLKTDCGAFGFASPDQWASGAVAEFAADLRSLKLAPSATRRIDTGSPTRDFADWFENVYSELVRTTSVRRVVAVVDEVDIAIHKLGDSWISFMRSLLPRLPASVSLILVGMRRIEHSGRNDDGSASTTFESLEVGDFDDVEQTHAALSHVVDGDDDVTRAVMRWTGGQPLLTMYLLDQLCREAGGRTPGAAEVGNLGAKIVAEQRNEKTLLFETIESYFLEASEGGPGLRPEEALHALDLYDLLRTGKNVKTSERYSHVLRNVGLCRTRSDSLEIKGELFHAVFDSAWVARLQNSIQSTQSRNRPVVKRSTGNRALYVINTGGTLGMVRRQGTDGDYVSQPEDFDEFKRSFPEFDEWFELGQQPFALDSINVTPAHWKLLAERIRRLHEEDRRRSFVLVHGTDTMAYTASALAFAFGRSLDFSIVLTGSQTTPDVLHGDARTNLLRAGLAAQENVPEVLIAFGDQLFRAVRARKRDERQFAGFEAVGIPPIGDLSERVEVEWTRVRTHLPLADFPTNVSEWGGAGLEFANAFADRVLSIQLLPGLEPGFYEPMIENAAAQCNGIAIQVLGAGNVTSDEEFGFHGLMGRAKRDDIPVLLTSRFQWRRTVAREYRPASEAERLGAIAGGEMTLEAALAKFRWALAIARPFRGHRIELVRKIMETNFIGELDGPLSLLQE